MSPDQPRTGMADTRIDSAHAAAVAALPLMTPQRLHRLLHGRPAVEVWTEITGGDPSVGRVLAQMRSFSGPPRPVGRGGSVPPLTAGALAAHWQAEASKMNVERDFEALACRGIEVVRFGRPGYPERLRADDEPPEVVFVRGRLTMACGPAVAIVGTRKATHYGTEVAAELGAGLASAGVCVVSGLAAGIDAAAHEGALAGLPEDSKGVGPLGIVGGGVDVYYPTRNRRLTDRVATAGGVMSEASPGTSPEPWRFPLRNRLIAALAQVVVIVESTRMGGAMHTVEAALRRGREVFAVPGSVHSLASEGTNDLLASGAYVARDVGDVLVAVERECISEGILVPRATPAAARAGALGAKTTDEVALLLGRCSDEECRVYLALDEHPRPVDVLCHRSGCGLETTAVALDQLMSLGLAAPAEGAWRRL
ncbi:MAG: DNA-processing protein DprA [Acidimicrobiales bacterium]